MASQRWTEWQWESYVGLDVLVVEAKIDLCGAPVGLVVPVGASLFLFCRLFQFVA